MRPVFVVAADLLREARARRWVLALALGITVILGIVAFGLRLEVVDGRWRPPASSASPSTVRWRPPTWRCARCSGG